MTPRELLDAFEEIAEARDGVATLRALVLDIAVRGRLLEQRAGDESGSRLLERIRHEREALIASGAVKPGRTRASDAKSPPFDLPASWAWCRLDDLPLMPLTDGDWVESKDQSPTGAVRLIQLADVGANEFRNRSDRHLTKETAQRLGCSFLQAGDVLIARLPDPIGRACLYPGLEQPAVTVVDVAIARLSPHTNRQFFVYVLNSPMFRAQVEEYGKGATRFRVATGHLKQLWFPVPPLAEQHRIVARVDELMSLLDRFEAASDAAESARIAARDAALRASVQSTQPDGALRRAFVKHSRLVETPEDVAALRIAIRRLGVTGHLGTGNSQDTPAATRVAQAESALQGGSTIRGRPATNQCISGEAALFVGPISKVGRIPSRWVACSLSAVSRLESGHTPDRDVPEYWGGSVPWIGIKDARVNHGRTVGDTELQVTQEGVANSATRILPPGTVCLSRTASIGYVCVMSRPMCTSQDFVNFVCTRALLPRYLQAVFLAEDRAIRRFAKGAVHLTIYFPEVKAFHLLLPPTEEQERILRRLDSLMQLCDALESLLTAARDLQSKFAAAAVHHLDFAPSISAPPHPKARLNVRVHLVDGGVHSFKVDDDFVERHRELVAAGVEGRALVHKLFTDDWGVPPLYINVSGKTRAGEDVDLSLDYPRPTSSNRARSFAR